MRATSIAAIAIALIATAPISAAADQMITASFSLTIPATVLPDADQGFVQFGSTPFPLFAPATGTLESVNVTLSGAISVSSLNPNVDVGLALQGLTKPIDSDDGIKSGMTNLNLSGTDQIPAYIGTGTGQMLLLIGSGDATPNMTLVESNGPLDGVVTYTYTLPTLAIPETPTWATMLIGFAGLGFAAHRATRKTSVAV
jgi:hypothetical protein